MVLTLDEAVHLLGNQHYPIKIEGNKIYVRPIGDPFVLTRTIEELNSELTITWEQTTTMQDAIVHHQH